MLRKCANLQVVEGKGFVTPDPLSGSDLSAPSLPQAAPGGIPRPPASTTQHPTPSPDNTPSASAPRPDEPRGQKKEEERRPDPTTTSDPPDAP